MQTLFEGEFNMKLEKIKGSTYYINAPTNIGVYVFKNKNCLLIDTGINSTQAKKINEVLLENGLHPKYILNTHSHADHCGGNPYFQSTYPGCTVHASETERLYMENPELLDTLLFSSSPIKGLGPGYKPLKIDFTLETGTQKINDEKFEIIPLPGHSVGQIGVTTPEKVCFVGDAVFSEEIIEKYQFPYLFHIQKSLDTLQNLKNIDADYFVISHANEVISKEQMGELLDKNIRNIEKFSEQILELLDQSLTREDILENISILNDVSMDFKQYFRNLSTTSAFIKHLMDQNLLEYSMENGKLYYFKKP